MEAGGDDGDGGDAPCGSINAASFGGALAWLYIMLLGIPEPAERDAEWAGLLVGDYLKALALQFTVQEAIKILFLTFVSPQFAATHTAARSSTKCRTRCSPGSK